MQWSAGDVVCYRCADAGEDVVVEEVRRSVGFDSSHGLCPARRPRLTFIVDSPTVSPTTPLTKVKVKSHAHHHSLSLSLLCSSPFMLSPTGSIAAPLHRSTTASHSPTLNLLFPVFPPSCSAFFPSLQQQPLF